MAAGDTVPILTQNQEEDEEASFMQRLKSVTPLAYYYQIDTAYESPGLKPGTRAHLINMLHRLFDEYRQGIPIKAIHLRGVKHCSFSELQQITASFAEQNILCKTPYGRLFQGTVGEDLKVLVKTWDFYFMWNGAWEDNLEQFHDEINLLRDPRIKSHPNIVKLTGFHCDKRLAVIYEEGPKEILENHLFSDNFGWDDRMKVAMAIGSVLKLFHDNGFVHGGIESRNILIDEAYTPKIFNFHMYDHSNNPDLYYRTVNAKYGYCVHEHLKGPVWSLSHDIFAYGVLLLELLTKKKCVIEDAYTFIQNQLGHPQTSFVHKSFSIDERFGSEITELVMECLRLEFSERPAIGTVMCQLEEFVDSIPSSKERKICH